MNELTSKVIVVIPHSSTRIPNEIDRDNINWSKEIESEVDVYTDEIYDFRKRLGNKEIVFNYHRAFIDVNQSPNELNDSIPLKEFNGNKLYKNNPSKEKRKLLLKKYHKTFHNELSIMAEDAILIFDGHSTSNGQTNNFGDKFEAEISVSNRQILSDNDKQQSNTCDIELMNLYVSALKKELNGKHKIVTNIPYLDKTYGYIEKRYGLDKDKNWSCPVLLQEINKNLYMDKDKPNKNKIAFLNKCFANALEDAVTKYFKGK